MIKSEVTGNLVRHYSDTGMMIKQVETGNLYDEAVDVVPCRYSYEETNTPIESGVDSDLEDAAQAAKILLGVKK